MDNKKLVFGIGINDITGSYNKKYYSIWKDMLRRCYDKNYIIKYHTYKDVYVCEKWKYLSEFKKWFDIYYIEDYQLDKDLYIPNNRIYSPDACLFIPSDINKLISKHKKEEKDYKANSSGKYQAEISIHGIRKYLGVYKTSKEAYNICNKEKSKYYMSIADELVDINDKIYIGLYRHASMLENGYYDF